MGEDGGEGDSSLELGGWSGVGVLGFGSFGIFLEMTNLLGAAPLFTTTTCFAVEGVDEEEALDEDGDEEDEDEEDEDEEDEDEEDDDEDE